MSHKVLIIGGGIIGMLTARELHQSGCSVTLLERQQVGRESTWAGGGIVSPLFPWRYLDSITTLATWSQQHYPDIFAAIHKDTGKDPQFSVTGMLISASDELEKAKLWAQRQQQTIEFVDSTQYREIDPQAAHAPETGIWMPAIGSVRNPRLAKSLHADLLNRGVEIITDTPVTGINLQNGICQGVKTAKGNFEAEQVVICAGSWSQGVLKDLPKPPAVRPVRGQMLLFKTEPGTITRIGLDLNRYIIPRRDGHVLYGSTMEDVGFDKSTTDEVREELHALVIDRYPILADAPLVKHWAGLRPGSPAGVPYIGNHPEIENLFINAGQYRNGIVLGAASARLLADLATGRSPIIDPSPYTWTAARG